jgi:polysaccharide biosynthesis protein PslE
MQGMKEYNLVYPGRSASTGISLRDLAAPLFRRRQIMIATFLIALVVGVVAALMNPSQYTSRMEILVNHERLDPIVTSQATTQMVSDNTLVSEAEINSEAELLKSSDVLRRVVEVNKLAGQPAHSFLDLFHRKLSESDRVEVAARSLAKDLKVEVLPKTNMIEVTYSSSDPQQSYSVLKALGDLYLEKQMKVHRPVGTYEVFAGEAQKYQNALQNAEDRLNAFHKTGAAAPDLERADLAQQLSNAVGQAHAAEEAIAADERRMENDRSQMKVTPERSATKQDVNAPSLLLEQLHATLLAAQTKRSELALKYDPKYPLVQEADREVASAKAAIAEAESKPYINQTTDRDPTFELLREELAKTETDRAAQDASLAAVRRTIKSLQAQIIDLDQQAIAQQDLEREVKVSTDNYLLYRSKSDQQRTSDALDKTRIANVALAVPPAVPSLPDRSITLTLIFAGGFAILLSLGMVCAFEYFDSSFHTPAQVSNLLGVPLVVAIPKRLA